MKQNSDGRCGCGWLECAASDPDLPVEWDLEMHEFHFLYPSRDGVSTGHLLLRHCPFCGGKAPESRRGAAFHTPSRAELERLRKLTGGLSTYEEVVARLGAPDGEDERGTSWLRPEREGSPCCARGAIAGIARSRAR
jgi:hypothetical protein